MSVRRLLERFLDHLHRTGALSVPPGDLAGAVEKFVRESK